MEVGGQVGPSSVGAITVQTYAITVQTVHINLHEQQNKDSHRGRAPVFVA